MTTHPWQNRIVGHADVDPLTLKAHPKNFRTHANQQRRLMEAALDELGHVGEIVVNQRSGRIMNGHLRVELAIGRAEERVPVTWVDVSDEEELVLLAFFDAIGDQAKIDAAKLRANFAAISSEHENLRTVIADWAASFQVTILPAKPAQAPAPPAPAVLAAPPAPVAAQPAGVPTVEVAPTRPAGGMPAGEVLVTVPLEPAAAPAPAVTAPAPVVVEATPTHATVAAPEPVVAQPAEVVPVAPLAEEAPEEGGLQVEEMTLEGAENPFADMFAAALAEDHQIEPLAPVEPAIAPVEEEAKGKKGKKEPAAPPVPTHALIKIGEYDQEVELSIFTPWWNQIVAQAGGDGYALMNLIKEKLGIVA